MIFHKFPPWFTSMHYAFKVTNIMHLIHITASRYAVLFDFIFIRKRCNTIHGQDLQFMCEFLVRIHLTQHTFQQFRNPVSQAHYLLFMCEFHVAVFLTLHTIHLRNCVMVEEFIINYTSLTSRIKMWNWTKTVEKSYFVLITVTNRNTESRVTRIIRFT